MKRSKILYVMLALCITLLVLFGQQALPKEGVKKLEEYNQSIDKSCQQDSDCTVKNVGNCCGYYPACTHVDAQANPYFVSKTCEEYGIAGICGFPSIEACKCQNNKCVEAKK